MTNSCNINDMNKAFNLHQIPKNDFDAAVEAYSSGELNPIMLATPFIRALVESHHCSENCVVFTTKDENTDNTIWHSVDLKIDRFVDGKYINNPAIGEIQTTFSLELLCYIVEHTNDSNIEFYKGSFSYGNRLLIKYLDESAKIVYLNFGDVGPV